MVIQRAWQCTDDALGFVEALGELTPESWRHVAAVDRERPRNAGVTVQLRQLARQHGAGMFAWGLDDGIDTAIWLCRHREAGALPVEAARTAALAVLLRPLLGEMRFRSLYAPFSEVIPEDDEPAMLNADRSTLYGIFVRNGRSNAQRSRVLPGLLP
jgi:hypothetical protein